MTDVTKTADDTATQISDLMTAMSQLDDLEEWDAAAAQEAWEGLVCEITCRVGAPFQLLLGAGGPTVSVSAVLGSDGSRSDHAELHVTHGVEHATRWSEALDALVDYYIEIAKVTA